MNQTIKILTALGMIFAGIGQMLSQYKEIMQKSLEKEKVPSESLKDGVDN